MLRPVGVLNLLPREGLEWLFTAQGLTGLWMFSIAVVGSCLGGQRGSATTARIGDSLHGGGGFADGLLERDPEFWAGGAHGHRVAAGGVCAGAGRNALRL